MANDRLIAPYEVEDLSNNEVKRKKVKYRDGTFVESLEKESAGFMVYFPAGHSIRVNSEAELQRMGLQMHPDLIDKETGEVQEGIMAKPGTLKKRVQNSNKASIKEEPKDEELESNNKGE